MTTYLMAQCVMCYRTVSAQQAAMSRVFNNGILILLVPPVFVMCVVAWLALRKRGGQSS